MAKKKSAPRSAGSGSKTSAWPAKGQAAKGSAAKGSAKPAAAKKTRSASSKGAAAGLFLPGGGEKQTAAEKSLASAVLAAGGTDKLLSILKHVEAAGGAQGCAEALDVYERMRRVLNPTNEEQLAHPLFESIEKGDEKKGTEKD